MAFRGLVDGECGGNNSLVNLASILSRDGAMQGRAGGSQADQFVDDYIAQNQRPPPQTFHMNTLLHSLRDIHEQGHENKNNAQLQQWSQEFSQQIPKEAIGIRPNVTWNPVSSQPPFYPMMMQRNLAYQPNVIERPVVPLQYLDEHQTMEGFPTEFSAQSSLQNNVQSEIQEKAKELVEAVVDQNVAYSQFISFMKKVGGGEIPIEMTEEAPASRTYSNQAEQLEKLSENYADEWAKLSDVQEHPWLSQFNQTTNPFVEYTFARENSMSDNINALEIGKERLKQGDVSGAVLCFESAVQQDPSKVEGWLLLGTTQAENEQDPQAIAALTKCVELAPTCLPAYMALGASYTNENYPHLAYTAFNNWLKANSKYSDLVPLDVDLTNMNNMLLQSHIQNLYIRAAQMNPSQVDPDIQCALGVLFNISQEYDKAVDCFKAALMVNSEDSRLWNRLGATLANGERSEEAVDAYYRALSLEPGFIRARYNVGITCMNLGAHKEAAEHFLHALNQQAKARGLTPNSKQEETSSTIWSTLRMVCAFMGKYEITPSIDNRDLTALNKYFKMEG